MMCRPFHMLLGLLLTLNTFAQTETNFAKPEELLQLSFEELDSLYYLYNNSAIQEALVIAEVRAKKAKDIHGPKDTLYAAMLAEVGMQHYYLGAYQKTIDCWTKSKDIYIEILGEEEDKSVGILGDVALLHYYLGQFEIAEQLSLQVLDIRAKTVGKDHHKYGMALNNLGLNYWGTERYEEAEAVYLESKRVLENSIGHEHMEYANAISNLASLYYDMGRKAEVEPLYVQTKEIFAKNLGKDHPHYASSINNLAVLYEALGKSYEAEKLYIESNEIRAEVVGKSHPNYAGGLRNLAVLYANNKRYDEALDCYLKAEKIMLKALGKEHPEYLLLLINIGSLYTSIKEYDKAKAIYLNAQKAIVKALGTKSAQYREVLDKLAELYTETKAYDKAWEVCFLHIECNSNQANIRREIDDQWEMELAAYDYYSTQNMYSILASIYELLSLEKTLENTKKQHVVASLAIDLVERNRKEFTGEEDQLRTLKTSAAWTHRVLEALSELSLQSNKKAFQIKAFRYAELNKSVLLANAIQTERAYSFGGLPDSLVRQEKALQESKSELKAALLEDLPEEELHEYQKELSDVNLELNELKDLIEKEYPKYSELKYQQQVASLEDLQPLLDDKTAIVEYVVSATSVHVFYIDQKEMQLYSTAIDRKEFDQHIHDLHGSLSDYNFIVEESKLAYRTYTENAYWLYEQLLAPVLKDKKAIKDLVIITDGELGHLPFETFLVERAPQQEDYKALHYLVEDYTISYAYSATLFVNAIQSHDKKAKRGSHEMLALAANYNPKDSSRFEHLLPTYQKLRQTLIPLPNAQQEVELLSALFEGDFLSGDAVSEQFFKEKAKDYSIIHLAMHGVLNHKSPILSALAFSENGQGPENNFLQAYEISQMDLNAALVVLSACETGYGEFEQGNGIASLARSFMYAGVPSMIVSLWQVNDQSTEIIMNAFYNHLRDGMNKAEALRQAKLNYLERATGVGAHPAFWSPFVQLGARESVQLSRPLAWWIWCIGGLLCLIAGGLVYRYFRERTFL